MKQTQTYYRLHCFAIEEVEVEKITENSVYIDGKRHTKEAGEISYHATYRGALERRFWKCGYNIGCLATRIENMQKQIVELSRLNSIDVAELNELELAALPESATIQVD